jgi:hypothetical protein
MSKEIDISELEWRFVWHGSGGKDLWNRRGGRICIGGANYNELLYVGENQFDLDNAESLIAKHNSDLLAVAQSKNAEIEKLKADLLAALEEMVNWSGKRGGDDDALLPADQQDKEVAQAMQAIARAKGEIK